MEGKISPTRGKNGVFALYKVEDGPNRATQNSCRPDGASASHLVLIFNRRFYVNLRRFFSGTEVRW